MTHAGCKTTFDHIARYTAMTAVAVFYGLVFYEMGRALILWHA